MNLGNTLWSLLEYQNPRSVIDSFFGSLSCTILGNPNDSLLGSLVGMSHGAFLGSWNVSLIGMFTSMLLVVPLGLLFDSKTNMY